MCYVGKATKIFIFIITVLLVTGLIIGFSIVRHRNHKDRSTLVFPTTANPIPIPNSAGTTTYNPPAFPNPNVYPPPLPPETDPTTPVPNINNPPPPSETPTTPVPDITPPPPPEIPTTPIPDISPPPPPEINPLPPPPPVPETTPPSPIVPTVAPPPIFSPPSPGGTPGPAHALLI